MTCIQNIQSNSGLVTVMVWEMTSSSWTCREGGDMDYSLVYQFVNGRREEGVLARGGGGMLVVNTSTSTHINLLPHSL